MNATDERNLAIAESYYKAIHEKDQDRLGPLLHADVKFVGPMATLTGKEAVLQAIRRFSSVISDLKIRSRFAADDQVALAYDVDFGTPIGICRTAVLMRFRDGVIGEIELFYDARPFEQHLRKDAIFSAS